MLVLFGLVTLSSDSGVAEKGGVIGSSAPNARDLHEDKISALCVLDYA